MGGKSRQMRALKREQSVAGVLKRAKDAEQDSLRKFIPISYNRTVYDRLAYTRLRPELYFDAQIWDDLHKEEEEIEAPIFVCHWVDDQMYWIPQRPWRSAQEAF